MRGRGLHLRGNERYKAMTSPKQTLIEEAQESWFQQFDGISESEIKKWIEDSVEKAYAAGEASGREEAVEFIALNSHKPTSSMYEVYEQTLIDAAKSSPKEEGTRGGNGATVERNAAGSAGNPKDAN